MDFQDLHHRLQQEQRLLPLPILKQIAEILPLTNTELEQKLQEILSDNPIAEVRVEEQKIHIDEVLEEKEDIEKIPIGEGEIVKLDKYSPVEEEEKMEDIDEGIPEPKDTIRNIHTTIYTDLQTSIDFVGNLPAERKLQDDLEPQVVALFKDPIDQMIALEIVKNLDSTGMLRIPPEDVAEAIGVPIEKLEKIRKEMMKKLDPIGAGAKDHKEVILAQLELEEEKGKDCSLEKELLEELWEHMVLKNEYRSINRFLEDFRKKRKLSKERVEQALENIKRFSVYPSSFYGSIAFYSEPEYEVIIENDDIILVSPKVVEVYIEENKLKEMLKNAKTEEEKKFLKEKETQAKNLRKQLKWRNSTIHKIIMEILKRQKEFLKTCDKSRLKPLSLKEIAEAVGRDESTVSRAVEYKTIETPCGIMHLKDFFHRGGYTEKDMEVSDATIEEEIKKIIASEDKQNPLSDDQIAKILNNRGIKITRRTVAKYRTKLGIPNAYSRKIKNQ